MQVTDWGVLSYGEAIERQRALNLAVSRDEAPEALVLVEHPDVITVTPRSQDSGHVLASPARLQTLGVELHVTDRGGDVTFHGPGQLVAYPIVRLDRWGLNLSRYMRLLEQVVMDTAARYGVSGGREPGATGVWVERMSEGRCAMGDGRQIHRTSDIETRTSSAKLCAMGVRVRKHTTMHGLALNVTTDLSRFGLIDPCGLGHRPVCSLRSLLGEHCPTIDTVKRDLSEVFIEALRSVQAEAARAT